MSTTFDDIISLILAIHALALVIVNLTPTPKDDAFMQRFYRVIEALAGIGPMAKR